MALGFKCLSMICAIQSGPSALENSVFLVADLTCSIEM